MLFIVALREIKVLKDTLELKAFLVRIEMVLGVQKVTRVIRVLRANLEKGAVIVRDQRVILETRSVVAEVS